MPPTKTAYVCMYLCVCAISFNVFSWTYCHTRIYLFLNLCILVDLFRFCCLFLYATAFRLIFSMLHLYVTLMYVDSYKEKKKKNHLIKDFHIGYTSVSSLLQKPFLVLSLLLSLNHQQIDCVSASKSGHVTFPTGKVIKVLTLPTWTVWGQLGGLGRDPLASLHWVAHFGSPSQKEKQQQAIFFSSVICFVTNLPRYRMYGRDGPGNYPFFTIQVLTWLYECLIACLD